MAAGPFVTHPTDQLTNMFDALAGADIPEMAGVPGSCGLPRPEKELPNAPTGARDRHLILVSLGDLRVYRVWVPLWRAGL
jgi:hypothetical protein